MLRLIKRNYFLLISVFLIFYFGFNLVSGERGLFSYCVEFLDQLHPDRKLQLENNRKEKKQKQKELLQEKESENYSEETFDRYSY